MNRFQINIKKLKREINKKDLSNEDELFVFDLVLKIEEINNQIENYLNKNTEKIDYNKIKEEKEFFDKLKPLICALSVLR